MEVEEREEERGVSVAGTNLTWRLRFRPAPKGFWRRQSGVSESEGGERERGRWEGCLKGTKVVCIVGVGLDWELWVSLGEVRC